jgi:hypothetical protein
MKIKMRDTISKSYIVDYIEENYGEMRQNADAFLKAIRRTSKDFNLCRKDLFHYIIERASTIPMTTSYGFDTAYGREIRQTFEYYYYEGIS